MHEQCESFRLHVLADLGAAPADIEPGRRYRFATNGKRSDLAGWCQLFDDLRGGVYGCWRSGISGVWTDIPRDRMTSRERSALRQQIATAREKRDAEQRTAWLKNRERNLYMQRQLVPVTVGDPVHKYLCRRLVARNLAVPPCLMLHPAAVYFDPEHGVIGEWPAMFAPLTAIDGRLVAYHRTYLTNDGFKADVPGPVRKLTSACGLLSGAAIRLYDPTGSVMGVAEGIETALGAHFVSSVPTMAAYSAGNLKGFVWPKNVNRLVAFADADNAGADGAEGLRLRAVAAGLTCEVLTPTIPGADWLDVYAGRSQDQEESA
jgi:phage/plasmid primase-like uncharacterized protein